MDSKEAKVILSSWRASGADAGDPLFTEALQWVRRDPELADWFEQEQALDSVLSKKIQELPVPETVRDQILAGNEDAAVRLSPRSLVPLALAAALAMLATLAAFWVVTKTRDRGFIGYQARMLDNLSGLRLDFAGNRMVDLQEWLAAHGSLADVDVPEAMQGLPTIGCKTWSWRGKPVALICFSTGDGRVTHLFVVPRSAVPDAPAGEVPQFAARSGWMTASWTAGANQYLAVQRGDEATLKRFLGVKG